VPSAGECFRDLVLQLRGRTGLTQRELATRVGVNTRSIQGWELGANYPGVASLKTLIAEGLQAGGFTPGREREEAQALWVAAVRDAPRFRMPFDGAWFTQITAERREPNQDDAERAVAAPTTPHMATGSARRESWGEAPDVADFLNRVSERALVRQWVLDEGSRLVAVLGLGGIGKSLLATRLAHDLAPSFERVFWRSLRDAPTPSEWLAEALGFLAPGVAPESGGESALLRRLLELLGEARCLLVLDNVETILQPGGPVGAYRVGYERYGTLLRQVAESPHRSCLVVTSREEPAELGPLLGERGPVRALELAGFGAEDGRALLGDKQLDGDDGTWRALIERYGGNGLALKVVGETARELFDGSIAEYLEFASEASGVMVGGVRQLLDAQIRRLSQLEVALLRRLAVAREPVGPAELVADLGPRFRRGAVLEALEGLRRRSLLERTGRDPLFALHSVVLEYVTGELIEDFAHELASGEPELLLRQPLLKATAKDYVRRSQERLIAGPVLERLVGMLGSPRVVEQRLMALLDGQRGRPSVDQGYGPGNTVNLLRLLRGDLNGANFSGLAIRQAYFQDVEAQGASLAGSHLSETVLGEAFAYPTSRALSADGAYLAVGTGSGEIYHWRVADRTLLATLHGHTGVVWGVALRDDGQLVASGGADGMVRLWDGEDGRPLAIMPGHTGAVWKVALNGDGRLVASGGVDGTVRLWDPDRGEAVAVLRGHTAAVLGLALSADGRVVASGGDDRTVRLWQVEGGRPLATLHGHVGMVQSVALSGDGQLAASAGEDGLVRLWETTTGAPIATLQGHTGKIYSVSLSHDGRLAATSGVDGTVRLWQVEHGEVLETRHDQAGGVRGVAMSGDGRVIVSHSFDGTVNLWEATGGRSLAVLRGYTSGVMAVALRADGRLVASGSLDGIIRLYEAESGRLLVTLPGHVGGARGVAMAVDSQLVVSGGLDGTVRVWNAEGGSPLAICRGHTAVVLGVAIDGEGRLIASSSADGTVRLWDAESGRALATLSGHAGGVWSVALSRDGRLVVSGGFDGTVRLWDAVSGRPLAVLREHTSGVHSVALSRDGRSIASGAFDGTVCLWDAAGGRPLHTLREHAGMVRAVALSGDGHLAASAGDDGVVRLWESASGALIATLRRHTGKVYSVSVSDDGQLVASGSDDGTVCLWASSTGACLRVFRVERRFEALDITGLSGITDAQRSTLFALGAIDRSTRALPTG
jgi:WD40 repeat protein/transcriptional regulator with XRE-family HTH domain